MNSDSDIRWKQRLKNFELALGTLEEAVELTQTRPLSELEKQGLIQAFEFTHELAWNVLKDFLQYQGVSDITGSRDATREAFQRGLISNGEAWMEMIRSRNLTTHTYNRSLASEIADQVAATYYACFAELLTRMKARAEKND